MTFEQISFTIYGVFLIIGGYFGAKKGSQVSLIAGGVSGILVLGGVYWVSINAVNGLRFLVLLSALLVLVFLKRLVKTKKFMPSGLLLVISIIMFLVGLKSLL